MYPITCCTEDRTLEMPILGKCIQYNNRWWMWQHRLCQTWKNKLSPRKWQNGFQFNLKITLCESTSKIRSKILNRRLRSWKKYSTIWELWKPRMKFLTRLSTHLMTVRHLMPLVKLRYREQENRRCRLQISKHRIKSSKQRNSSHTSVPSQFRQILSLNLHTLTTVSRISLK